MWSLIYLAIYYQQQMLFFIARYTASPAAMPTTHGGHLSAHKILPDNISTLFAEALKKFEPISCQPTDSYLTELCEVLS